jgi:hypothetical protein
MNALAGVRFRKGLCCMEMLKLKEIYFGRKVVPVPQFHAMKAYLDMDGPKIKSFHFPI